ncbi:hypothetical protein NLM27_03975 [Bradyrhizobium sp. CCGB12]|uniref:hypothetical protein n=1 Tax=Bradyrhizobium sp. CCGB12 TaxID=2949632 RepID=UPI0020B33925|nr:hypothetical protein [Bradyrhizobium sp. CCGB12]MCP3387938.1 hypothetical protein [Bradyrhizobium sp. CCGB12]
MDEEFCRERLRMVRELAEQADPFIKKRLMELARHYERRIAIGAKESQGPGRQSQSPRE